jgi:hypothetical protein
MEIKFSSFDSSDILAVNRFNQRFDDADGYFSFSESEISRIFKKNEFTKLFFEFYIAKDKDGEVRGGYYFKNQEYYLNKETIEIVFMQLPLSEGIINKNYKQVGPMIFEDMEERRNLVFVLGMGGFQYPLPKRLKKNGWFMYLVPFYFFINKPNAFLNDFEYLNTIKKSFSKKILINIVKVLGLLHVFAFLSATYTAIYKLLKYKKYNGVNVEIIEEFSAFTDELWEKNKFFYSIIAKRDQHVLNQLYPKTSNKFHKLKITKKGVCIGWVVLLCTKMENDKYFGNLKLGTLIDAFSKPDDAELLINQSVRYLKKINADLIVVNHTNISWGNHFKKNGFIKGPSNFIFGISKRIKEYYKDKIDFETSFLMRGDGDGPINL